MITLASDFGTPYPAAMKGVLLGRTDARLVDVGHDFPRQDVRTGAFWLREALPSFPPATHLVVIDPGVGTDRTALVVRASEHALVGPDNGVLLPAARRLADGDLEWYAIDADPDSATFHGRDVFAPAAAAVHEAGPDALDSLERLRPIDEVVDLQFPAPVVEDDGARGAVLVVDDFGNAVTNVPGTVLDGRFGESIAVNGDRTPVARSYAHLGAGARLVTVGSHGNAELAVNRGRGDDAFDVAPGDEVRFAWA